MNRRFIHIAFAALIQLSCNSAGSEKQPLPVHHSQSKSGATITIDIQPFTGIPGNAVQYVLAEMKKVYPYVEVKPAIPLPQSAFYAPRNRYRADSLINFLNSRTAGDHVTIGLTVKDISATAHDVADWGVMGLGFCPGRACVASMFRLSKTAKLNQLFKVAIHEAGHTQGLQHCPVNSCFMRDAEGKNPTDEETGFCPSCKKHLIDRGWMLN